jgi:hypothetical protein
VEAPADAPAALQAGDERAEPPADEQEGATKAVEAGDPGSSIRKPKIKK